MNTFNLNRFCIVAQNYLNTGDSKLLTPAIANKMEPVLYTVKKYCSIRMGYSLNEMNKM